MADIKTASFIFGAKPKDALQIEVDAKSYKWDASKGDFIHTPTSGKPQTLRGDKLHDALSKAGEGVKTSGFSEVHHFDQVHEVAAAKKFRGSEHPLSHVIEAGEFREAYKAGDAQKLGKMMVTEATEGAHLKLVPDEEVAAFRRNLVKVDEHAFENLKGDVGNARKLSADILATDFADAKFDKAHALESHVDGLVGKYGTKKRPVTNLTGLVSDEASKHINKNTAYAGADDAIAQFVTKAEKSKTFLTDQAEELVKLRKTANATFVLPKTKEAAKASIEQIEKSVAEHLGQTAAHGSAYQELPKNVRNTLDAASAVKTAGSKAVSDLGAGVSKAAGKDGGIFTKKAADLVKFEAKQLEGMKGLWNKRTMTGKVALVGIPTVAVAYMAGIGSKGKHADQVASQQLTEQGAALGA